MKIRKHWKRSLAAMDKLIALGLGAIAYGSNRDWFIHITNSYFVGLFEGACAMFIITSIFSKYGDAINEAISGLRALGRKYIKQKKVRCRRKKISD